MKKFLTFFVIVVLFSVTSAAGQDAYHTFLLSNLQSEYGLTGSTWVLGDTEIGNYNRASSYGAGVSRSAIQNQNFSQELRLNITQQGGNPWDAAYTISNLEPIEQGDKILLTFSMRSEGGPGSVNILAERRSDFSKEVYFSVPIGINWQTYYVSFEAINGSYSPGQLLFGFHLASQIQDVRVGGFTALNYGADIDLNVLPSNLNNENYGGSEPDAAWRSPAADRIDALRKADLKIIAVDDQGTPIENVLFEVKQHEHLFAFGTAIKACRLGNNSCSNIIFQNKLANLDGKGHGFNWVVFENDLKWNAWEENWFETNQGVANAATWLRDRNIGLRGHALLWPGFDNMPDDVRANASDTSYVWNRIRNHFNDLSTYPDLADDIRDWDVINETVTNVILENEFRGQGQYTTGRELYGEVFAEARKAFPNASLYLNDYVTISVGSAPTAAPYIALKRNLAEIVDAGNIDGIGFQGHVGTQLNDIQSVLDTYDDFYNSFGLQAKVTEFDLPAAIDDSLAATYMGDFLTATFSHPSMNGFFFWNFWDTDTWQSPSANMFRSDWTEKPALATFTNKVFEEWWTDENVISGANGEATIRAFKGQYEITYLCGGEIQTKSLWLSDDEDLTIVCTEFTSSNKDIISTNDIRLFPNPNNGSFSINSTLPNQGEAVLFNLLGAEIWRGTILTGINQLSLKLTPGLYNMQIQSNGKSSIERIIVQ